MRVLVTGGAGFIGSVVARELLGDGHRTRVIDSLVYGGHALLGMYHQDDFDFVCGDIRSSETVSKALEGVDAVVHLAAIVGDQACARNPEMARDINLTASLQLFNLAQAHQVKRFIFASTCSNYGKMSDAAEYLTEDSELRPVSDYANSKVSVERELLGKSQASNSGITVIRLATVFGLSPRMRFDLTVNDFVLQLYRNKKLMVYGEQFWRPYIHVLDAARAILTILKLPVEKVGGSVFNIGDTSQNYKKSQIVDLICAEFGQEADVQYVKKSEDPRDYRVDFGRARSSLGFTVTMTVEDGIREILDSLRHGVFTDLDNPYYRN